MKAFPRVADGVSKMKALSGISDFQVRPTEQMEMANGTREIFENQRASSF